MPKIIRIDKGIYLLEIFASKDFILRHPKFVKIKFEKGYYYYCGSAQKNLSHRIGRHIKKKKKIHWHIDYFTTIPSNHIERIFVLPYQSKENECKLVKDLSSIPKLIFPAEDFGNSDCTNCKAHLLYSKEKISYNHFIRRYQSIVRFIPESSDTV